MDVTLRDVTEDDLSFFYDHQRDEEATRMAAFPSRDWDAFTVHWTKILANEAGAKKTILAGGEVAGNIVAWDQDGKRLVGYWIGKEYWGKGVATKALASFVEGETRRPLHAYVAAHNVGSIKVLERCGFVRSSETGGSSGVPGDDVEEFLFELS